MIILLLDYKADLNILNDEGLSPVAYASQKMLKELNLEDGAVGSFGMKKKNLNLHNNNKIIFFDHNK